MCTQARSFVLERAPGVRVVRHQGAALKRHRFGLAGVALAPPASPCAGIGAGSALAAPKQQLGSPSTAAPSSCTTRARPDRWIRRSTTRSQGWQIEQATQDGLVNFKKAQGTAAYTVVPDLAVAIPKPTDGGKTWVFKLRSGIKFSNGQVVKATDVLATFQRIFKVHGPHRVELLRLDRRRRRVHQDARDLHAQGRRHREQREEHRHVPPHEARRRVAAAARRAAREHRPGGHAAEGSGRQAGPGHGPVHDQVVRPEPPDHARAQPVLQGVVEGRTARRLSRRDHAALRPHG